MLREKIITPKRLVDRLTDYWRRLKKDDILPQIQKINSGALDDVWDNCFILEIEGRDDRRMYLYKYMGSEIKKAYGVDMTGQHVSPAVKMVPGSKVLNYIEECVSDLVPHEEHGTFINTENKTVKFRSCILPFSSRTNNKVTHLLVGLSWRAF
jgi:hypothetical protein